MKTRSQADVKPVDAAIFDAAVIDAVVIGAGFGGLGAALRLAEGGARVVVFETVKYAGGCASTFSHRGYRFDAGATLLAGLGEGQLFTRWLARHDLAVEVETVVAAGIRDDGVAPDVRALHRPSPRLGGRRAATCWPAQLSRGSAASDRAGSRAGRGFGLPGAERAGRRGGRRRRRAAAAPTARSARGLIPMGRDRVQG